MKHLQFPFAETVTLVVKNGKALSSIECELAFSEFS
jgi:hypothetical protein